MQAELLKNYAFLTRANARLEALATTDGMTGLANHRAFQEQLRAEIARAQRNQRPFGLLLLDVDYFKQYNDAFGHPAGDDVLRTVATVLQNTVRTNDFPARYGGEEFAVLLPDADAATTRQIAERIRAAIAAYAFAHRKVTASIGIAHFPADGGHPEQIITVADQALYRAKNAGRNRVVIAGVASVKAAKRAA